MTRLLFLPLLLALPVAAADPTPTTADTNDRAAIDVLKDLHNRGADLYNAADAPGALRTYDSALRAVAPFLAHRPKVQKMIDDGLADAAKLDTPKAQAYKLHEVIDAVRTDLKAAVETKSEKKPEPEPKQEIKLPNLRSPLVRWSKPFPW